MNYMSYLKNIFKKGEIMPKLLIYKQGTEELIQEVKSYRDCYKFQLNYLRNNGVDTYVRRPVKKKTIKQTLDKQCEDLWREIALHDANHICEKERCGRYKKLDVHHIITRSVKHLRWDLDNAIVLCSQHHTLSSQFSAHKTPDLFRKWLDKYRGSWYYEKLQYRANFPQKTDLKLTLIYLKQEAKKRGIL